MQRSWLKSGRAPSCVRFRFLDSMKSLGLLGLRVCKDILYKNHLASNEKVSKRLSYLSRSLAPDRGRSMYLPAEWGPRTRETTLLGDSATTTRCAGLGHARKGFSKDQDERL